MTLLVVLHDLSLSDPLHVALEVLIQLLGFPQLLKLSTGLGLLSLFCELTSGEKEITKLEK